MIKVYLKQAWQMLRQNKLYSSIYIIGTGMAIAMTMTIALIYYIKIAPVYPEMNRDRTLIISGARIKYLDRDSQSNSALAYPFVKDYLLPLETPETLSCIYDSWLLQYSQVELPSGMETIPAIPKLIDDKFWHVFNFNFIDGKPFTKAEFDSGIKTAVISASLANTLYGSHNAEGKRFKMDGNEYRVSGVVENATLATPETYADVWIPFTVNPEIATEDWREGLLGSMKVYMLARSASDFKKIKAEVDEVVHKINTAQDKYEFSLNDMPTPHWKMVFKPDVLISLTIILLALIIVPAVNLAGLVSSRMEKRLPEIGIRKTFGASRGVLLNQILTENLLLTLMGGAVGLIISYIIMYSGSNWILTIMDDWPGLSPEGVQMHFTSGMLFNPKIFLIAFGVCFILNFMSAIMPAYHGLKKTIIYSLNSDN